MTMPRTPPRAIGPQLRRDHYQLTPRQREILVAVMRGYTNAEIAREVGSAHQTVKNTISALIDRFGASNRADLVAGLIFSGVLRAEEYYGDGAGAAAHPVAS